MDKSILDKLDKFLKTYENINDVIGVLVCGSYVTGHPNSHSDLDVHLVLNENVNYRERGNRIVDGLLIEYFANTQRQIEKYFSDDYSSVAPMSQTQFATGKIIRDDFLIVENLKVEAREQLNKKFSGVNCAPSMLTLYAVWDMLDDLQSIYEEGRADFDFIYFNNLDKFLKIYFKSKKIPYNAKTVVGHITNETTRQKYLLEEIKDEQLKSLVVTAITSSDRAQRLNAFSSMANELLNEFNFNIENFTFKSDESL